MSEIFVIKSQDIDYLIKSNNVVIWTESDKNAYYCTDIQKLKMFYNSTTATDFGCIIVATEALRKAIMYPVESAYYYTVDSNCLYQYIKGLWTEVIITKLTSFTAYRLDDEQRKLIGEGANLLDNNGLLHNGTVVVRDSNKLIKGTLSINESDNSLDIVTTFGGDINLYPGGKTESTASPGVVSIKADDKQIYYDGRLTVTTLDYDEGDIGFVDSLYTLNGGGNGDDVYPVDALIIDNLNVSFNVGVAGNNVSISDTVYESMDAEVTVDAISSNVSDILIPGGTYKGVTVTFNKLNTTETNNYFSTQFECQASDNGVYPDVYAININASTGLTLYDTGQYPKVVGTLSNNGRSLLLEIFFIVKIDE
jgi:hypothetical protein